MIRELLFQSHSSRGNRDANLDLRRMRLRIRLISGRARMREDDEWAHSFGAAAKLETLGATIAGDNAVASICAARQENASYVR